VKVLNRIRIFQSEPTRESFEKAFAEDNEITRWLDEFVPNWQKRYKVLLSQSNLLV
jgi:hypothetical protein